MFQEIVQAIIGIVNVLNISDKLDSLDSNSKKKKLGKQFLKLYESISRSIKYSQEIESELKEIVSLNNESFKNQQSWLYQRSLPRLAKLLTMQKYELLEFQKIIQARDEEESRFISLLIEIYGGEMELEFNKIIDTKRSIIDWIDYYLLKRVSADEIIIPKTFKLSDIPVFKTGYGFGTIMRQTNDELYLNPALEQEFMTKIDFKEIMNEDVAINLVEQCSYLIEEIIEFDSTKKLLETKSQLANIIRSNFTIEEII